MITAVGLGLSGLFGASAFRIVREPPAYGDADGSGEAVRIALRRHFHEVAGAVLGMVAFSILAFGVLPRLGIG